MSPDTIRTYRGDLEMFQRDIEAQGLRLDQVTVETLKAWLWKKKENGASPNHIRRLTVVLKNFYGLTAKDLKTPRAKNVKPINVLSHDEVRELYEAAARERDKAIVTVGYKAGARRSEIMRLNVGDITFQLKAWGGRVRLHGKGGKIRNIPLDKETLEILSEYLATRGDVTPSDPLFTSSRRPRRNERLTVYGLHHIFRRLRKHLDIPDAETRVHFHMLRHCFAKHLYEAGVKIRALQRLLGHSSIAITEKYLILLGCEVAEEYLAAAPALSLRS